MLLTTNKAKPFLKWAGGKGQLVGCIEQRLPVELINQEIKTYVEPFVGGGAIFFHLAQSHNSIEKFYLFDVNQDLVNCYNTIKNNVEDLIEKLCALQEEFLPLEESQRKEMYLEKRKQFNAEKQKSKSLLTASLLLFLNKTCFNGLYRVNKSDLFNVPSGKYKNPKICNQDNLRATSKILQKASIFCGDFSSSKEFIDDKTFVYLDPPYRPISSTSSFNSYSKDVFCDNEQIRLSAFCEDMNLLEAKFLLSNSDPKNENPEDNFFETHYSEFNIDRVKASRIINCKGSGRGQINELLITNY